MGGKLEGEIVSITDSGNLVTDIGAKQLAMVPRDESVSIRCDGHMTAGIFPADHDEPELTFLAVVSEHGWLQLVIVGESASKFLGIKIGEKVGVAW